MILPPTVQLLQDAINSHDPQRVAGCFAVDYRCEMPMHPSRSFTGSATVHHTWTGMFASITDLHATVLRTATGGDETWSEWEMTGTGPDGGPALIRGTVIWTVESGAIAWARFYLDPVVEPPDAA